MSTCSTHSRKRIIHQIREFQWYSRFYMLHTILRYTHLSETTDWFMNIPPQCRLHENHINVLNKEPKTAHQNITQFMLEKIRNLKYWKDIKVKMLCLILGFCNSIVTSINLGCFWGNSLLYLEISFMLSSKLLYNCSLGTNALLVLHLYIPISI